MRLGDGIGKGLINRAGGLLGEKKGGSQKRRKGQIDINYLLAFEGGDST